MRGMFALLRFLRNNERAIWFRVGDPAGSAWEIPIDAARGSEVKAKQLSCWPRGCFMKGATPDLPIVRHDANVP